MPNTLIQIYVLRSRCLKHDLDTMRTFTLKGNEAPDDAFNQMEYHVRAEWKKQHDCTHKIKFDRITEKNYRYNTRTKEVEKV